MARRRDPSVLWQEELRPKPPALTPEERAKRTRWIVFGGFGVIVAAFLAFAAGRGVPPPSTSDLRDSSTVACEKAVEGQLTSPGSARFGGETVIGGAVTFSVRGYVDSQNGFGALGRSTFHCGVEYDPAAKTYQITDFELT